jgi:hypothetical protein
VCSRTMRLSTFCGLRRDQEHEQLHDYLKSNQNLAWLMSRGPDKQYDEKIRQKVVHYPQFPLIWSRYLSSSFKSRQKIGPETRWPLLFSINFYCPTLVTLFQPYPIGRRAYIAYTFLRPTSILMQEKGIFGVIITAEKHLQISLDSTYLLQIHV